MSTIRELATFKCDRSACKFFYHYENVVNKSLPDSERVEKIVVFQSVAAFDFYFVSFTLDNSPTDEAKDYAVVKKMILENFST